MNKSWTNYEQVETAKGSNPKRKCHKMWKKSIIFLPPPPLIMWTILNLGKIWFSMTPPPPRPKLVKIWNVDISYKGNNCNNYGLFPQFVTFPFWIAPLRSKLCSLDKILAKLYWMCHATDLSYFRFWIKKVLCQNISPEKMWS